MMKPISYPESCPRFFQRNNIMVFFIMLTMMRAHSQYDAKDFIQYTIKEGLSDNNISCITQDNRGFIWIGTEFGLNRFDGDQFEKFFQGTPEGFLTSSTIHEFSVFRNNRLGIITRQGLQVVNTDDFSIHQYSIPDSTRFISQLNFFTNAMEFGDGTIGVTSATGFYVFQPDGKLVFRHDAFSLADVGNKRILFGRNLISITGDNAFVYVQEDSQALYDIKLRKLRYVDRNEVQWKDLSQPVKSGWRSVIQISDHEYMFMTRVDSLIYFDIHTSRRLAFQLPAFYKDRLIWESNVFIRDDSTFYINGGYNGFYSFQFNREDGRIRFDSTVYLRNYKINYLYSDHDKRLWVGTTEGLLKQKFQPAFTDVYHWPVKDISRMGYTDGYRNGDKLYFSRFSRDTGLIVVNASSMQVEKKFSFYGKNNPWNEVFMIEQYYADTLWLATNGGLLWFDVKTDHYGKVSETVPGGNQAKWTFVTPPHDDVAWMCDLLDGHVARYHILSRHFDLFDDHSHPALPFLKVKHLCIDSYNNTWLGGHALARWNNQDQVFDTLLTNYGGPNPYEDDIKLLRADEQGSLWMHNLGNGLLQYKIDSRQWVHYGMREGLPSELIQSMSNIREHTLWMTSQNQLIRFDTETGKIETYDHADGIPDIKPIAGNMFEDEEKRELYVFYKDHVLKLPFDYHQETTSSNDLVIQRVMVNNTDAYFFPAEVLKLETKDNNLAIEFTVVDFHEGQPYRFAYRMDPKDDWTSLGYQRTLHLTNLAPGAYTMEIGATSKSGVNKTKILSFNIAPPFWATTWFILACTLVFASLIYLIYRIRISQVQQKANLDKLLSQTEMKALHAQMNPHFIFNSLNSIREMILNNETQEASRFLGNFAHLIRITLDQSRQPFISLRNTMDYINRYIEMERIRNPDFHFSMDVDKTLELDETILPPLLIQPFIENAIWHGMNGEENEIKINVRFRKNADQLICIIEDDGIGIDQALKKKNAKNSGHQSVSIANIKKRIELLNQKHDLRSSIDIEDKTMHDTHSGTGTIVRITLPLDIKEE
ncbi:MAG TPA: histidine kinase [Saprospiraceae bacterium]|nr:histidine kinase [Saprospiraceae bacterium]